MLAYIILSLFTGGAALLLNGIWLRRKGSRDTGNRRLRLGAIIVAGGIILAILLLFSLGDAPGLSTEPEMLPAP